MPLQCGHATGWYWYATAAAEGGYGYLATTAAPADRYAAATAAADAAAAADAVGEVSVKSVGGFLLGFWFSYIHQRFF